MRLQGNYFWIAKNNAYGWAYGVWNQPSQKSLYKHLLSMDFHYILIFPHFFKTTISLRSVIYFIKEIKLKLTIHSNILQTLKTLVVRHNLPLSLRGLLIQMIDNLNSGKTLMSDDILLLLPQPIKQCLKNIFKDCFSPLIIEKIETSHTVLTAYEHYLHSLKQTLIYPTFLLITLISIYQPFILISIITLFFALLISIISMSKLPSRYLSLSLNWLIELKMDLYDTQCIYQSMCRNSFIKKHFTSMMHQVQAGHCFHECLKLHHFSDAIIATLCLPSPQLEKSIGVLIDQSMNDLKHNIQLIIYLAYFFLITISLVTIFKKLALLHVTT